MSDATESREITSTGRHDAQLKVLARTADEIREHDKKVQEGMQYSLKHAIKAGQLLSQCKKYVGHGGWLEWFESRQFTFSERTAQRYMSVATRWKEIAAKVGKDGNPTSLTDLTFSDALTILNRTPKQPSRITHKDNPSKDKADLAKTNPHPNQPRSNHWCTPAIILERVQLAMQGIDLDPAADADRTIQAERHYIEADDGLATANAWFGRVFLNPPVMPCLVDQFVIRLVNEFASKQIDEAILVAPADIDQKWFRRLAKYPRVFIDQDFTGAIAGMPDPLIAIHLGHSSERFFKAFQSLGDAYVAVT